MKRVICQNYRYEIQKQQTLIKNKKRSLKTTTATQQQEFNGATATLMNRAAIVRCTVENYQRLPAKQAFMSAQHSCRPHYRRTTAIQQMIYA